MTVLRKFQEDGHIFLNVIQKAQEAAEAAGDKWVVENTKPRYAFQSADIRGNRFGPVDYMLDVCGFAWINFKDKHSRFYKMCQEHQMGECPPGINMDAFRIMRRQYDSLNIRTKHSVRQEMGLAEACMRAAVEVINDSYPGEVYMKSRID